MLRLAGHRNGGNGRNGGDRRRDPQAPGGSGSTEKAPESAPWWLFAFIAAVVGLVVLAALTSHSTTKPEPVTLTYTQLVKDVSSDQVKSISIGGNGDVTGTLKTGAEFTSQLPTAAPDPSFMPLVVSHGVEVTAQPKSSGSSAGTVLWSLVPLLLMAGLMFWLFRRASSAGPPGGLRSMTATNAKVAEGQRPSTRFADVAGYEGVKSEVQEVVDFLKRPERYTRAGATGPKGILMVGPPGTGKTMMARAVAGEASVPFFALTGSSFVELYVGVGASRVRELFGSARQVAPAIVFIDEIDAIGGRRGVSLTTNDEREQTLNQLLAEMDGFDRASGVVVMAATNRPDTLDPALLRPGRFDRVVEIPLPNQHERRAILGVHTRPMRLTPGVNLDAIARATPGFSGADLANLANEAAINAVRFERDAITPGDFDLARDRILLGRRQGSNVLTAEEKQAVAVHEAGHAVVAALAEHADPVSKVTILPSGHALGVTEQLPESERHLYPESYLRDSLMIRLGGRASEVLVLGEASTGAADDLSGATDLATRMVRDWGLSSTVGPVGYSGRENAVPGAERPFAEATQRAIDREVAALLDEAQARASVLLQAHSDQLAAVVQLLLDRETVDGTDVVRVLHGEAPRPESDTPAPEASVPELPKGS